VPLPAARSRSCVIGALCLIAIASAAEARGDGTVILRARAGIGGLVKSGRWAPVFVEIERGSNAAPDISADLVVSWGDATVRRRVFVDSAARRQFELYVRTNEAGAVIRVHLDGADASAELPVTVLPYDSHVTLCVSVADERMSAQCSVTLGPYELPVSARGYEVVDEVVTSNGAYALSGERRAALDRWRAVHALESSGDLSLTPQVTRPPVRRGLPAASAAAIAGVAAVYVSLLVVAGLGAAMTRASLMRASLGFTAVLVGAAGASAWIGHVGPGSDITVHHTSLLQQIPGSDSALVSLRGVAESPSDSDLQLTVPFAEAMIEASTASGRAGQTIDEGGLPMLLEPSGLGVRHAFAVEGIADITWVTAADDGRTVRVTNVSNDTLRDCRFADGMSVTMIGELASGASVTAERRREIMGPVLTCTTSAPAISLASPSRAVAMTGTTTVAVYQRRPASRAGVLND
jgi:hypothetical protein